MANPNIVTVTTIEGKTDTQVNIGSAIGSPSTLVTCASNKIIKVNTVMASNKTGSNAKVSLRYDNGAYIAFEISIPIGSSIALIGKDTPIYVEETDTLTAYSDTASAIDIVTSYEIISNS